MIIERQPLLRENLNASEFFVSESGFVTTDATWYQEPMYLSHSRVYYVLEGSGVLYSENEKMILEPGYVYLAPCGMKYGFYGTDSVTKLYFHINLFLSEDRGDVFSNYTHFIRLPRSREHMVRLKELAFSEDSYDHVMLKGVLWDTVSECLQLLRDTVQASPHCSETTSRAVGYIYRHLNARLTVKEVVEASFCSQSKLSALFHCELNRSVAEYIDDLLMSEAKNLLIYTEDSIGNISERLGFCDQFYFSRRFTKRFGISPLQFRKKEKGFL